MNHRISLLLLCSFLPSAPLFAEELPVTRLTKDGSFKQHLKWSPDGKQFLFTRIHEGKMAIWLMKADGTEMKRLVSKDTPHFDGDWSADSKRVVFVLDILQGTDGKLQIDMIHADGTNHTNVLPHKAFDESPRFSPDEQQILWVSTRDGNPELYVCQADGTKIQRLTSEVAFDLHPAWSPDGKKIAFSSGRSGKQKIYAMDADGKKVKRLTEGEGIDSWPAWSPDGKQIAFVSHREGNYDVFLMNSDGSGLRNLTHHSAQDTSPTWSPDGKSIAFISTRDGGSDVYILQLAK